MEDHFILRAPPALAARLRRVLAEDASSSADAASLQLEFSEDGRTGQLHIGTDVFPAKLLDLPTKVESWKSLDDVNLVKSADIGQIIVVSPPGGALPSEDVSVNGVTVALRCVSGGDGLQSLRLHTSVCRSLACACSWRVNTETRSARSSVGHPTLTRPASARSRRSCPSSFPAVR
jgi:TATA-binding protein-associated factor Taf7